MFKINKKTQHILFPEEMVTSLANIFTIEKLVVKIIFGSKSFICSDFQILFGRFSSPEPKAHG